MSAWEEESINCETRPMIIGWNCVNAASCGFTAQSVWGDQGEQALGWQFALRPGSAELLVLTPPEPLAGWVQTKPLAVKLTGIWNDGIITRLADKRCFHFLRQRKKTDGRREEKIFV
jgi:hypothetical protein